MVAAMMLSALSGYRQALRLRITEEEAKMAGTHCQNLRTFFASQLIANSETAAHVRDQRAIRTSR